MFSNKTFGIIASTVCALAIATIGIVSGVLVKDVSAYSAGDIEKNTILSAGYYHTMTIDEEGHIYSWGGNYSGGLGNGNTNDSNVPIPLASAFREKTWSSVSSGTSHSLAIDTEGFLYAWGYNLYGQLGTGNKIDTNIPTQLASGYRTKTWKAVSAGYTHSLAIDSEGHIYGWGFNEFGTLGDGTNADKSVPTLLGGEFAQKKWKSISAGTFHSLAIDEDGYIYGWGNNSMYGTLGVGQNSLANPDTNTNIPVELHETARDKKWKSISAGHAHSMAIDENDKLYMWGSDTFGQLGLGSRTMVSYIPVTLHEDFIDKTWLKISAGQEYSLAIDTDGYLYAWGQNFGGQLGISEVIDEQTREVHLPTLLAAPYDTTKWVDVSAGGYRHSVAIDEDGNIYAWGENTNGEVGIGSTENAIHTPALVTISEIIDPDPEVCEVCEQDPCVCSDSPVGQGMVVASVVGNVTSDSGLSYTRFLGGEMSSKKQSDTFHVKDIDTPVIIFDAGTNRIMPNTATSLKIGDHNIGTDIYAHDIADEAMLWKSIPDGAEYRAFYTDATRQIVRLELKSNVDFYDNYLANGSVAIKATVKYAWESGLVENSYNVIFPSGTGFIASAEDGFDATVIHGDEYKFRITLDYAYHNSDIEVRVNNVVLEPTVVPANDDYYYSYTIPARLVTDDLRITVSGVVLNTYIVTLPEVSTEYTVTALSTLPVIHGSNYLVKVTVKEGAQAFLWDGESEESKISAAHIANNDYYFAISVTADIKLNVLLLVV